MTTHVLIVDSTTFKLHLEYLFVGTGAGDSQIDFNNRNVTSLHHSTENNLVGMIADGFRIRQGDDIIFYLQQDFRRSIFEGKFYGLFRATTDWIFLDDNDSQQFLKPQLRKSLTFRTLIKPSTVYAEGVTEWEALDEIRNVSSPNQMLWSLIYRKLKGNRGNTMITIYESERLGQLLRNKNDKKVLNTEGKLLSFDSNSQKIVTKDIERPKDYVGRKDNIDVLPRLIAKYRAGNSFEAHLQAYLTKVIGKGINPSLDAKLLGGAELEWLGNEVSCGVGMQRIDVMASVVLDKQKIVIPIELKAVVAEERNLTQIQRYVDWVEQYYIPNRPSDIQPVLIAQRTIDKGSVAFKRFIQATMAFNHLNEKRTYPLKYIEFQLREGDLHFAEVPL